MVSQSLPRLDRERTLAHTGQPGHVHDDGVVLRAAGSILERCERVVAPDEAGGASRQGAGDRKIVARRGRRYVEVGHVG